jgi:hypothetical protein
MSIFIFFLIIFRNTKSSTSQPPEGRNHRRPLPEQVQANMGVLPSKPDSSKSLQVIGAGFSRTGTLSTALAFEKLFDGPSFHGGSTYLLGTDRNLKKWTELFRAKRDGDKDSVMALLRELMAGYVGTADAPPIMFIPELLEIYPEAKVVLNTRNPERWWRSMRAQMDFAEAPWARYLTFMMPGLRWFSPSKSFQRLCALCSDFAFFQTYLGTHARCFCFYLAYELYVAQAGQAAGFSGKIPIRWGPCKFHTRRTCALRGLTVY